MELNRDFIKKYTYFKLEKIRKKSLIEVLFLNLCLILISFIFYSKNTFIIAGICTFLINVTILIMLIINLTNFKKVLLMAIELLFTFIFLNFLNFALMQCYEFCSILEYGIGIIVQIFSLIPSYFLNRHILKNINKNEALESSKLYPLTLLMGSLGGIFAYTVMRGWAKEDGMFFIFCLNHVLVIIVSIVQFGFFYKGYLMKKYKLE